MTDVVQRWIQTLVRCSCCGILFGTQLVEVLLNGVDQRLRAVVRERRNAVHWALPLEAHDEVLHAGFAFVLGHHVELVEHQPARLVEQLGIVFLQLADDGLGFSYRVDCLVERSQVHHVQQHARALQVSQELVTQARTFGSAFDQARNVGHHERLRRTRTHHTQVRVQRRERVIGNLRARVGDGGDQRRLAGVRHAEQAHIG